MPDKKISDLIKLWQKRNISGEYFDKRPGAAEKILGVIPKDSSIGFSGSVTLDEIGIIKKLEERGNKVFNPYKSGINREENLKIRRDASQADYYLASANAISQKGELVFFSGYGNRTAGISFAKNVIIVCGINKLTANINEAIKRSREIATPLNCKRLNWAAACLKDGICRDEECLFPEYKRMCCQIVIIEAEVTPDRLKVFLVGENLGF